ncbi:MAG: hypothetical protein ACTFAK_07200 [Candidatus Electronema sp. VV]
MPRVFLLLAFFATLLFGPPPAAAQMDMMMGRYDPSSLLRVMVWVDSVNTLRNPSFGGIGLHLFAKDLFSNLYLVHVSPQWYADNHPEEFTFRPGDQLLVTGSRFATGLTENNILAATVTNCSRNFLELRLRDMATGAPLWHNQPDNLLERIQAMQKLLFSERSQKIQRQMEREFSGGGLLLSRQEPPRP